AGAHGPVLSEIERAAGTRAGVFDSHGARAAPKWGEELGEAAHQSRGIRPYRPFQHYAPRLLLANLVELRDFPCRQAPGVTEFIKPQASFHENQGVLGHQVAVALEHILEQRNLEPARTIVEIDDGPRPALLHLIDQPGHGDGLATTETHGLH